MPPKSHGRPKQTGRAAAHAAAHAASRHKASTVEVGSGVEEHVRSLLAGLDVGGGGGGGGRGSHPASAADAAAAYDGAVAAGFTHAQARRALTAIVKEGASASLTLDAVLDWLCLHTPPADLPKRFAGAARAAAAAAGPVTVVARANKKGRQVAPPPPPRDFPPSESESESEASDDGAAAAAATATASAAAAADKEASKAYILRYTQEASSESESGGSDVDGYGGKRTTTTSTSTTTAPPSTSDIEFSKYAVWADPRAVERRRAERARAALPPDERRARVVEEWAIVRAEAARAKAAGDVARQNAVGPLLGALKREAAELGLTDAQLESEEEGIGKSGSPASSSSSGAGMGLFADGDDDGDTMQWDAPTSKAPTVNDLLAAAALLPARRKKGILPPPVRPRTDPKPPKRCCKRCAPSGTCRPLVLKSGLPVG